MACLSMSEMNYTPYNSLVHGSKCFRLGTLTNKILISYALGPFSTTDFEITFQCLG